MKIKEKLKKTNPYLLLLILLLLVTNIISITYNFSNIYNTNFQSRYSYIDLSRNFINQRNFIINLQPLRNELDNIIADYGKDNIALYIEFMNTGSNIAYNTDTRYFPASLLKLPYIIAAVKKVEDNQWQWDTKMTMYTEDIDLEFGDVGNQPIGTQFTLETLVKDVLVDSDNTAFKIISRNLGYESVSKFLELAGLKDLFDSNMDITVKEYTRLIRSLYTASYLTLEDSQNILKLLGESKRNFLGQAIPDNVIYSHKFGENVPKAIFLDSGIVYLPDRPYMITLIYKSKDKETIDQVNSVFNNISNKAYQFFSTY